MSLFPVCFRTEVIVLIIEPLKSQAWALSAAVQGCSGVLVPSPKSWLSGELRRPLLALAPHHRGVPETDVSSVAPGQLHPHARLP